MNYIRLALAFLILMPGLSVFAAGNPDMIPLNKAFSKHNLKGPYYEAEFMNFRGSDINLRLQTDSRKLLFNNILIWLNTPVTKINTRWHIEQNDLANIITPLLTPTDALLSYKPRLVVLDPGHGGSNIGAIGPRKTHEKKIVLDIAKRTKLKLEKAGINVKMTREDDRFIQLPERVNMTSAWKADLLVSIHANFAENKAAEGIETYITSHTGFSSTTSQKPDSISYPGNKFDRANIILAYFIHRQMLTLTSAPDRGIRLARFSVIRDASCPAVLIECGFISNADEETRLINPEYRDKLAEGIARGILQYIQTASR